MRLRTMSYKLTSFIHAFTRKHRQESRKSSVIKYQWLLFGVW